MSKYRGCRFPARSSIAVVQVPGGFWTRQSRNFPSGEISGMLAGTLVSRTGCCSSTLRFQIADTAPALAYATLRLSGNHDGLDGRTRSRDNCLAFLPSIPETHTSVKPLTSEMNARSLRSGEIVKCQVRTPEVSSRIAPLVILSARSSTFPSLTSLNITSPFDNHRV